MTRRATRSMPCARTPRAIFAQVCAGHGYVEEAGQRHTSAAIRAMNLEAELRVRRSVLRTGSWKIGRSSPRPIARFVMAVA